METITSPRLDGGGGQATDGSRATGRGSGTRSPRQRYSDEGSFVKPMKKKGGFTSFVNSVLGSPRKMLISGPENPVHVMHVGYDNETGQFTVCFNPRQSKHFLLHHLRSLFSFSDSFHSTLAHNASV